MYEPKSDEFAPLLGQPAPRVRKRRTARLILALGATLPLMLLVLINWEPNWDFQDYSSRIGSWLRHDDETEHELGWDFDWDSVSL